MKTPARPDPIRITLQLPPLLYAEARELAQARGISFPALVRMTLIETIRKAEKS